MVWRVGRSGKGVGLISDGEGWGLKKKRTAPPGYLGCNGNPRKGAVDFAGFNDGTFGRHYIATCQSMVWDEPGPGGGQAKHTRRLPVETTLVQEAHSKACEVCECDRSCLGAGGWTWSRPGSRRSAPSPVARAVHGEIVHHAGGHTSSSQTPRTCSGCRARSCSHQGSAGLITCLVCWMRCSLPPICIWVPSLPPPPLFRPEASSSSPSRILLAWPQGRGGGKGGGVLVARWSIRGLGIHPAHPRTVPDRIASGGLVADATPPPLIRLPDSCGRGLEASTTTQSVPLQENGRCSLQPGAWSDNHRPPTHSGWVCVDRRQNCSKRRL